MEREVFARLVGGETHGMGRVGASQGEGEETDRVFVRVASPEEWRAREEESRESGGMETSGGVCAGRRGIAREREEEEVVVCKPVA